MTYYGMHAHEMTFMNSTWHAWMNSTRVRDRDVTDNLDAVDDAIKE